MFVLREINVKRFMSLKDVHLELPPSGTIHVRGATDGDLSQSNGAGKSALVEAVYWALTGKTLRGSKSEKNWDVSVVIGVGERTLTVHRSKQLSVEGLEGVPRLKSDIQEHILDKVVLQNLPVSVFRLLCYHTPYTISDWFVKLTDRERKEIISTMLGMGWLDTVQDKISDEIRSLEVQKMKMESEMSYIRGQISVLERNLERTVSAPDAFSLVRTVKELFTMLGVQREIYLSEDGLLSAEAVSELEKIVGEIEEEVGRMVSDLNAKITEKNSVRSASLQKINDLKMSEQIVSSHDMCPTCLRPLSENDKEKILNNIRTELESIQGRLNEALSDIKELQTSQSFVSGLSQMVVRVKNNLFSYKKELEMYLQESSRIESVRTGIEELKKRLKEKDDEMKKVLDRMEELKTWKKIFSPTGVKAVVLDDLVREISEAVSQVAEFLGLPGFKMGLSSSGRLDISLYKQLSSGERRRVEIALVFALRSVLPSPSNMVVLDEVFDHLDQQGISSILPLVEVLSQDSQVWVISHRPDLVLPGVSVELVVDKDSKTGNATVRVLEAQ